MVSVFAKVANPEKSWVEVNHVSLNFSIEYEGGKLMFSKCLILRGVSTSWFILSRNVMYVKASSYIAQCPVLWTVQSALHITSLTDLFTQTPSRLLWEASSHMLQLMRECCSYIYPPLSIARYSFHIELSELEQFRVKKCARGFNTAAQDLNLGSRSRECEALCLVLVDFVS